MYYSYAGSIETQWRCGGTDRCRRSEMTCNLCFWPFNPNIQHAESLVKANIETDIRCGNAVGADGSWYVTTSVRCLLSVAMTGGACGDQPGQVPQGTARPRGVRGPSRPGWERYVEAKSEESQQRLGDTYHRHHRHTGNIGIPGLRFTHLYCRQQKRTTPRNKIQPDITVDSNE